MKTRLALALAALALLASACGTEPSAEGGVVLRYGLQPGYDLAYDVSMSTQMAMTAEGEGIESFLGATGDMAMTMDADLVMGYAVSEGPDPDTIEIRIGTEIVGGTTTLSVNGEEETIDLAAFPEAAGDVAMDVVVVIGPTGEVIEASVGGEQIPLGLFGDSLTGIFGQGMGPQGFAGPVFPDHPVSVGDSWTTDQSAEVFGLDFEAEASHRYAGDTTIAGREVAEIESQIVIAALDVDLVEMIVEMMSSPEMSEYAGADAEDMELAFAMFEALDIQMRMTSEESVTTMTTWFDPVDGIVVKTTTSQPLTASITLANVPEVGDMRMDLSMGTAMTSELRD